MRFFDNFPSFPRNKKGEIHLERIKEILSQHPAYAGYIDLPSWGISMHKGKHEPLVSLATYQKANDRLHEKAKAPARKDISVHFPLPNFVLCGDCGTPITACMSKGRSRYYLYYLCHN